MTVFNAPAAPNLPTQREYLTRSWWIPLVRGVVSLLFGIYAIVAPLSTAATLVMVFGIYALIDGVFALVQAFRMAGSHRPYVGYIVEGILGVLFGLIAFVAPGFIVEFIVYIFAGWAILTGLLALWSALHIRRHVAGEWGQILSGVLSILLGILLFVVPAAAVIVWSWTIGIYAVLFGIAGIVLAFRLRKA